ncbi:hypothetical protein Dimus_027026 [Dionaea muscipula]
MSKLACISAAHNDTYVICMDMVNEASRKVGIAIGSIMSTSARAEASSSGVVEENVGAVVVASNNSIGVFASNYPELRDSSTKNVSSSQFRILDLNISQTKGRKKGKETVSGSGRMKSGLEMATKKNKGCVLLLATESDFTGCCVGEHVIKQKESGIVGTTRVAVA